MDFLESVPVLKNITQLWVFFVTWVAAEILLFIAIRLANRLHLHDKPDNYRKIHNVPIPTIGGVPIFFAFIIGIYFTQEGWVQMQPVLIGAGVCMVLGLVDDIRPISAVIKLIVLFCVTYLVYTQSADFDPVSTIQVNLTDWALVNLIISLFWIVGLMSAINSLDNMDGLASGITAIACIFIFFIAWAHWQRWLSFMAVGLCAANLTFLKYNFFQARAGIFLGDNGSYFIGFVLACMAMMGAWTDPKVNDIPEYDRIFKAILVPPLLLGVPIFDIIVSTVLRLVNGEVKTVKDAIVYCGTDHTSHRLVALGFSRRQAVLLLWGLGIVLGTISLVIQSSESPKVYLPLFIVTMAALFGLALILNRAKVYKHQLESPA